MRRNLVTICGYFVSLCSQNSSQSRPGLGDQVFFHYGFILSILFFVFYYLCLAGGEELADRRVLAPWFAMWAPNIAIGAIGLVLTLQAAEVIRRPRRKRPRPAPPRVVPA